MHPWPNCSHAPQQIAWAWAWAWAWAAVEARTAVARWKWMLRCPWCDAMRWDRMCCHVNWQHLRRNLSQDQPADTFNLVRRRDTAEAPMCPNPHCDDAGSSSRLADAMWRCDAMPGATIRADYACPVWHFVDFCADILWIFSVLWQELFIIPFLYAWDEGWVPLNQVEWCRLTH